jgi:hypothetical protein
MAPRGDCNRLDRRTAHVSNQQRLSSQRDESHRVTTVCLGSLVKLRWISTKRSSSCG